MGNCISASKKTQEEIDRILHTARTKDIVDFGDKESRSGEIYSVLTKSSGEALVQKKDHSIAINGLTGASRRCVANPADLKSPILSMREYGKYLILFVKEGPMVVTDDGAVVFKSKLTVRATYPFGHHKLNYNRNIALSNSQVGFLCDKQNMVVYNLKNLIASPGACDPVVTEGPFEDFCISEEGHTFTLTEKGKLRSSATVNVIDRFDRKKDYQYTAIEAYEDNVIISCFSPEQEKRDYILYNQELSKITNLVVPGYDNSHVHNMLLYEKDKLVYVLATTSFSYIDLILLNVDEMDLIESRSAMKAQIHGLVWKARGQEALIYGPGPMLKLIKLP